MASKFKSTRRSVLAGSSAGALATFATFKEAHGLAKAEYLLEADSAKLMRYEHVHDGKGAIDIKFFFRAQGVAKPALLLIYNIPPGASEGVHTHRPGDKKEGSFDEFYYILEGQGEMEIAGKKVPVTAGDQIFTPNEMAHGIENTSQAPLKVYLIAIVRD